MTEFKRENRYAVFKLKNLTEDQRQRLYDLQMELGPHNDVKECVVVEHDWPNYEHVWQTVEQVANGTWSAAHARYAGSGAEAVYQRRFIGGMTGWSDIDKTSYHHYTDRSEFECRVLYTHPAPAVPEGYVLVPSEPLLEVLKISDRKHDAWDAVKAAIAASQEQS